MSRATRAIAIGSLVAVLVVAWLIRPWLHGIVMAFYVTPALLESALVLVLAVFVIWRVTSGAGRKWLLATIIDTNGGGSNAPAVSIGTRAKISAIVVVALVLALAPPLLSGPYAQSQMADDLAFDSVDSLPDIDADRPRILPQSVAEQYAANSLQYPRYQITSGDITIRNGSPAWSFGLAPDGGLNQLLLTGKGAVFVDMTTARKRIDIRTADPKVSFGIGLSDGKGIVSSYRWRLLKEEFLVSYQDPIMIDHEGEVYMAVPYISYDHHTRLLPIPSVYSTPKWGGVALISPDGDITHLSPEEARQHEVLAGQRLYPFSLARYQVQSMRYKNGLLNKWFVHEGELEVAPVPGEGNDQPFLTMTESEGITYFVAAEPYGNAQGIYQIWTFDGRTGEVGRYQLPVESALLGPRKAANFVRKSNAQTDWDRFDPSEPVPVVINDTLHWQVRVVPTDSSGIAYTSFVNAESGDVYSFQDDAGVRGFLQGERTGVPPGDGNDGQGRAIVITIRNAEGEVVDRVTVGENESIEIGYRNATAWNATEAGS